jgi:hypothetical protein
VNPVRATTVPKIEEGSEFRMNNTLRIVDMKTHNLRGNQKPKNPIRKLMHLKACRKPSQGSLEKMANRIRIQLENASSKRNHQPKGRRKSRTSRTNRRGQTKPKGILEGDP